jgi:hypothetical protein
MTGYYIFVGFMCLIALCVYIDKWHGKQSKLPKAKAVTINYRNGNCIHFTCEHVLGHYELTLPDDIEFSKTDTVSLTYHLWRSKINSVSEVFVNDKSVFVVTEYNAKKLKLKEHLLMVDDWDEFLN